MATQRWQCRCCCTWFPPTAEPVLAPHTGHKATGSRRAEVLVRSKHPFHCSCFGDGKGTILLCHLFFCFFCSPKQPTQILCETKRGINMEINDTETPSIPDATITFSSLLHLGPAPRKSTRWGDGEESRTPVCPETGNLWTLIQISNTVLHCGRY